MMKTIEPSTTSALALAGARRLAGQRPEVPLPCPVCATSVKGANLERHLGSKHPNVDLTMPRSETSGEVTLVGVDRRIRRSFGVLVVLWLAVVGVFVFLHDGPIAARDGGEAGIGDIAGDRGLQVLGAGLLFFAAVAALTGLGAFRARLSVQDGKVRLRYRLGTGDLRVALPATLETGTLFVRRRTNGIAGPDGDAGYESSQGAYLRIGTRFRGITVGCPHATGLRKHWTGTAPGKRRKWWDVNLAAPAFVELQYALAEAGVLTAKD